MKRNMLAFGMTAVLAWGCGVAVAQPGGSPPRQGEQGQQRSLKERLEQRREQARRMQERLDRAIKQLEDGVPEDQIRDEFADVLRARFGMGGPEGEPGDIGGPGGMDRPFGPGGPGGRRPEGGEPDGMDRPGGERWRDRGQGDRAPTEEDRAAIRAFLRESQPRLFAAFEELEKSDPEEARRKVAEMFPRLRPLLEMRKADPEMFELRMKDIRHGREAMESARWLAENAGSAAEADVTAKRESLRKAIVAQFEIRGEIQERDLNRQARRIEEARAEMRERQGDRESAIEGMMNRMIERERERIERGEGPDDGPPPHGDGMRRPGGRRGGDR